MTVPFLDLARLHASIGHELEGAFREVISSGAFVGSSASAGFEDDFARMSGLFAVGCGSGTDALALALRATGVRRGDEVVVPAMTFIATAEAVLHVGAVPVMADVDPETLLIDEKEVDRVRSVRTKAVIPVHLYGHLVPFEALTRWRGEDLLVVEDAAQAHLATYKAAGVGTTGDAACFSFYPGKNLGALGDAGMVASRDRSVTERVALLRDHGRRDKYVHEEIGWCSRLDGLQAAFLSVKLRYLTQWTDARRRIAAAYLARLGNGSGVTLVPWEEGAVHHILAVRVAAPARDAIRDKLREAGVSTGVHYPVPLSSQPSLAPWTRRCPRAEEGAAELVSLPIDPLMTESDVDAVCAALTSAVAETRGHK